MSPDRGARRRTVATATGVTVGALAYLLTLLDWGTSLTRRANGLGYASNFFDVQARSLMAGHLWVPDGSLSIEGFELRGHEYMYFGPWPALLRIPVLATTHEYDGRLTVLSMALAFVVMAVVTTKLLWLVREMLVGDAELGRGEAVVMALFLALALGGTTLTYDASLPWVYHEVYAWAVPFVLGAMYWMLRVLRSPDLTSVRWLLLFDLGAVMTRTTGGFAVCLASVAAGVWLLTGRVHPRRRAGWAVVAAGVLPVLAGVALNYAKFRNPYLFPLQDQVWTTLNAHRRAALAANGGTITGLQFFPTAFMAYLRPDGIRFTDYFPFVTLPAHPARAYDGAFLDQSYRTGSVTSFMPWLLALSVLSLPVLLRPGVDLPRRMLRVPVAAGVLVTGGVMAYGYFAFRYTCEFVPALVLGGAIGTVTLTHWLRGRRVPTVLLAVVTAVAAVFSIGASMLTGWSAAAATYGGPDLAAYLSLQHRLTPAAQARLVVHGDGPPTGTGRTDEIYVEGDCDAVYLASGEDYTPWLLVERRSLVVRVQVARTAAATRVPLVRVGTKIPSTVWLQTDGTGRARTLLVTRNGSAAGQWFDILDPGTIRVGVLDRPELGYAEVSSNPGGEVGFVPSSEYDEDWVTHPIEITPVTGAPQAVADGIGVTVERGLTPPTCAELTGAP
ncbi:MAG: hypothetical protein ACXVWZ_01500 [Nocardioides sp.]